MPSQRKIAISGSSGFVGSRLVTALKSRGYEVIKLVRSSKPLQRDERLWNPESGLAEPHALNGVDAIVHLAGRSIAAARWTEAEKNRIYDSRVAATKRLTQQLLALEQRPPVFISASAVGIYGDCGDKIVDETESLSEKGSDPLRRGQKLNENDSPPKGQTPFRAGSRSAGADFLSEVARDWEAASLPLREAGVRVAYARLGVVLTPTEGALAKMLPLFRWGLGGRLGNGKQFWSWIAIEDVIAGLCWLLENSQASGPYNLVSPQPVTNSEFSTRLANAIGRPAIFPAPKFALRLALGEMADALLLTSCRAVPSRLTTEGFVVQHADLARYLELQL